MTTLVHFRLTGQMPEGRRIEQIKDAEASVYSNNGQSMTDFEWDSPVTPHPAIMDKGSYAFDLTWQIGAEIWKLDKQQAFDVTRDDEETIDIDLSVSHIDDVIGAP